MSTHFLDDSGLLYLWTSIKAKFTGTSTPVVDGTAAVGSSQKFAREDHVHPTDTSRAPVAHAVTTDTYGKGTSSNYGHVLLSDATDGTSAAASGGTASTPKAVADALQAAKDYADGIEAGVSDVTVDGTSVVTSGVAAIDLTGKVNTSAVGSASGVCPLDSSGLVDVQYLPSYVDDVIEAYPISGATELSAGWLSKTSGGSALTPEAGKIYVLMAASTTYDANMQFRWAGTAYVKLADGGITSITNAEIDTILAN